MMDTTFLITGGAGRVVCAIPALEKFHRLNPNDNFKVLVHGWDSFFWSNPLLQERTFEINQKGNFDLYVKNNKLIVPEPYYNYRFYNQQINLIEAFDEEINKTQEHTDLKSKDYIYLSSAEKGYADQNINFYKNHKLKNKVIVFQPFGSSVEFVNDESIDQTNRSLSRKNYYQFVQVLSEHAAVVYMGPQTFRYQHDEISIYLNDDIYYLRNITGIISKCDYFIGVDSLGQHIARSFSIPGFVMLGGTDERNISYPDHFHIYRKSGIIPNYIPMRITDVDCNFKNRINDGALDFSEKEINDICKIIIKELDK